MPRVARSLGESKTWSWRLVSLIGVSCSSLCVLGLPLLVMWASSLGARWLLDERITRGMLLMFLAMYGLGAGNASRVHRRAGPMILAVGGGMLLIGTTWHLVPPVVGWIALATLGASWLWDWRLLAACHQSAQRGG